MKISLNTVKQYIDFDLPGVTELVERINAQLGKLDEIIDLGSKYKDALIVRVVSTEKHPDADRLTVTKIDDGGVRPDAERDENSYVQVVCGAPNCHADMWAVWLPPKSIVPSSFNDAEPFTLDSRELRGVMSHGMLAAADELAIGSDHEGIIELTERDLNDGKELRAGASFAKTFDLDDTIIDIENKMFTHRPDLFGQLGVAREIAGIFGKQFEEPDWYWGSRQFEDASGLELDVFNDARDKSARFMAVAIKNITIGPSPFWLQAALVAMGSKPVNSVVDLTNYMMLISAQPVHAYDYDTLRGGKLGVRMANEGETIKLLNNKTYELNSSDIVIADGEGAIGLAGIMGGMDSEVTSKTKNIVLEVANFNMYTIRKSSMRHGLFTDAVTRFNKGQSPLQNDKIVARLMSDILEIVDGAAQASPVIDLFADSLQPTISEQTLSGTLKIEPAFINQRLGLNLPSREMEQLLRNVRFSGYVDKDNGDTAISFTAPFWRTDIELPEDIVEEVGRLYGFDKLPRELPMRTMQAAPKNARRSVKQMIRESLSRAGANEVLTYSFIHENIMKRAEQDSSQAFKLGNALSPELQYYRLTVLPSLLDKVHMNIKAGHDEFALFEIGKGHNKKYHANDDEGLPGESNFVDAVYASKQPKSGAAYYHVRRLVDQLCTDLGFAVRFKPIENELDFPVTAPFDLARSALLETADGTFIGMIGELRQSVVRGFKLPEYTAAMTLDLSGLQASNELPRQTYVPLSKFPSVTQDISLKVASGVKYEKVFELVRDTLSGDEIEFKLEAVAVYQSEDDSDTKTITLRVIATSNERTLADSDVSTALEASVAAVKTSVDGERV